VDPTGTQSAIPVPPGNLPLLRDRIVILSTLGIVTLLSWIYLIDIAQGMDRMMCAQHCAGMMGEPWTAGYFTEMLEMWIIMMVGMMVPSAIPMVLIYASVARKAARQGSPLAPTGIFVTGYVVIWSLFSLGATIVQWTLDRLALLSPMMMSNSQILAGLLLLAAGIYQVTPVKDACLRHCRSPVHFLSSHWNRAVWAPIRVHSRATP
jgi:predicted metal-binding membrane protein